MNVHDSSPLSQAHREPLSGPVGRPATGYGYPVLSHPATVPPQMPLRRVVSQSETISAPCQYETLGTHLEAVYGPYSTSAPLHTTQHVEARQDTNGTEARTSPLARVVRATRVAILTALTRPKSHHTKPFEPTKEIGCYRQRGRGRGCDPTHASKHPAPLDTMPVFPPSTTAMELSTNLSPALSALAA